MTPPQEPEFASAAAVAGLAREVEGLRRGVDPLRELPGRVDDLARLVAQLADAVKALSARKAATPAPSWLMLPTEAHTARAVLEELTAWMAAVYLRYTDGAGSLPECWCWHPDVVEELLWLMHAWCAAYQGTQASVALAGDWHDRQRPGVVRRIRQAAGTCSLENHITRPGWDHTPTGAPRVPSAAATELIAAWWGAHRDQPAPEPAPSSGPVAVALDRDRSR
jgi:hypothetical protein